MAGRWIAVGCGVVVIAGAAAWFFGRGEKHEPAEVVATTMNNALNENGAVKIPEVRWRGNVVKAEVLADKPGLGATMVSLKLENAEVEEGFAQLSEASGVVMTAPRRVARMGDVTVNLVTGQVPLMEAMLSFEATAGVTILTERGAMRGRYFAGHVPGVWSVSGPLAFVITGIEHTVSLSREGKVKGEFKDEPGDHLWVGMAILCEPKVKVLQYPGFLKVSEAVDERGNSLLVNSSGIVAPRMRYAKPLSDYARPEVGLFYPSKDAGRRIKRLVASGEFVMQGKSEEVVVEDPLHTEGSVKEVAGMKVTLGKMTWDSAGKKLNWQVDFVKGAGDGAGWEAFKEAVRGVKPKLEGDSVMSFTVLPTAPEMDGDKVTMAYRVWAPTKLRGAVPGEAPVVSKVVLEVPTKVERVTVPVEFDDLPLP